MRRMAVALVALAMLAACDSGPPAGGPPAGGPSGVGGPPVTAGPSATVPPGGTFNSAAYCQQIKTDAPVTARLMAQAFAATSSPVDVRAAFDQLAQRQQATAALAPTELAADYRLINDDLQHARTATEQAGWTPQAARQQLLAMLDNERHVQAAGDIAGYTDAHCGG
jgi:hypothetical protein